MSESDIVPFFSSQRRNDNVRGSTDDSSVSAVAGTDRESPPHIVGMGQSQKFLHLVNQGNHRCRKRNIVYECGSKAGQPENGESESMGISADRFDSCSSYRTDNTCSFKPSDDDKETDKEE